MNRHLFLPDAHHGLDWNVFTEGPASPLAFLEASGIPALAIALPRIIQSAPGPSADELERRAFGWIVILVAGMLAAMRWIPTVHTYQSRLRSLNMQVPVH